MKRPIIKIISLTLIITFTLNSVCYGLATWISSQNPIAKREIMAALERTQIRYAESEDARRLLEANNASCLLLSSGKYLVTKEVADNDIRLLRAIIHEDIEAIMQIIAKEDSYKYQAIKELILKYFPPDKSNKLPIELYVNHTVARAFEWLILLYDKIILEDEIPQAEIDFLKIFSSQVANRHNYFTAEFWDSRSRGERIRQALNKGMVFYQTCSRSPVEIAQETLTTLLVALNRDVDMEDRFEGQRIQWFEEKHIDMSVAKKCVMVTLENLNIENAEQTTAVLKAICNLIYAIREKGYADDNLIIDLPNIAKEIGDTDVFLDALFVESELFNVFLTDTRAYEYYWECRDQDIFKGYDRAAVWAISKSVFSIYKDLLSTPKALKDFVRMFAKMLREDPSLRAKFRNEAQLYFYLSLLSKDKKTLDSKIKCIVVDADGVLWKGILDEDGQNGIQITKDHIAFQKTLLTLKRRGFLLAINSRNKVYDLCDKSLRGSGGVLCTNRDMVLRSEDFAVIKANWQDKAANLREIANELNIGLDSLLFIDDDVRERELVRQLCPEITTPDMPDSPGQYADLLENLPVLKQENITNEDRRRTELYEQQRRRDELRRKTVTLADYYDSLGMKAIVRENEGNREYVSRIAQLTQRTNQFNLTTHRYREEEIASFLRDPSYKIFTLELMDKFGNDGIVGAMILHLHTPKSFVDFTKDHWEIDTFCLSCRAMGRAVETAFFAAVASRLKKAGINQLIGTYQSNGRNESVADLYKRLGFTMHNNESWWDGNLENIYIEVPKWINVLSETELSVLTDKNLSRGQISELGETHPVLDKAANDGRMFAVTLEQFDKLHNIDNETLVDLLMSNLLHLRSPPETRQKLLSRLQDSSFKQDLIKGFAIMNESIKWQSLPQDRPIRLCVVIEDENLPTIVFKDPYNNLMAHAGKGKKTDTPFISIYVGYKAVSEGVAHNRRGLEEIIQHESVDIQCGCHSYEELYSLEAAFELYNNILGIDEQDIMVEETDCREYDGDFNAFIRSKNRKGKNVLRIVHSGGPMLSSMGDDGYMQYYKVYYMVEKTPQTGELGPADSLDRRLFGMEVNDTFYDDYIYTAINVCDDPPEKDPYWTAHPTEPYYRNHGMFAAYFDVVAVEPGGITGEDSTGHESYQRWYIKYRLRPRDVREINFSASRLVCGIVNNLNPPLTETKVWDGVYNYNEIVFNLFAESGPQEEVTPEQNMWLNRFAAIADDRVLAYCVIHAPGIIRSYTEDSAWNSFINALAMGKLPENYRNIEKPARSEALPEPLKKCLVLDCDGVLWGGVVGEDGAAGIQLTPAHIEFQRKVKTLKDGGVILAINSKNNQKDIEDAFRQHPEMPLKWQDFAAVRANWQDKATNMMELEQELNIGMDSFVFIDDSPEERALIRMKCASVLIPDFPEDPGKSPLLINQLSVFTRRAMTEEDERRTELYRARAAREEARKGVQSLEDYYRSLDMRVIIREGEENLPYVPRLAQLSQRTNQFNLTARRYGEDEIRDMITHANLSPNVNYFVYSLELIDKFGNNGIVGMLIVKKEYDCGYGYIYRIDEFCLSCRALGLTIERAFMSHIISSIPKRDTYFGTPKIIGQFTPTQKNSLASDIYEKMGFKKVEKVEDRQPSEETKAALWEVELGKIDLKFPEWIKPLDIYSIELNPDLKSIYDDIQKLLDKWAEEAKKRGLKDDKFREAWQVLSDKIRDPEILRKLLLLEINYLGLEVEPGDVSGDFEITCAQCDEMRSLREKLRKDGYEILKEVCTEVDRERFPRIYETYDVYYAFPGKAYVERYAAPFAAHFRYDDPATAGRNIRHSYDICIGRHNPRLLTPDESHDLPRVSVMNRSLADILERFANKSDEEWKEFLNNHFPKHYMRTETDKNLSRGQISEPGETHPALDKAANEGRMFAVTLGELDKLQDIGNEALVDLLMSNLMRLRSPPETRQRLLDHLQESNFKQDIIKGFTLIGESVKGEPLPNDKPVRLCVVIEDENLPTIVFKDPYNNLIAHSGRGQKTDTPYTSVYAGYNSLKTAIDNNQEGGFKEIIRHEAGDIIRGYHVDEKIMIDMIRQSPIFAKLYAVVQKGDFRQKYNVDTKGDLDDAIYAIAKAAERFHEKNQAIERTLNFGVNIAMGLKIDPCPILVHGIPVLAKLSKNIEDYTANLSVFAKFIQECLIWCKDPVYEIEQNEFLLEKFVKDQKSFKEALNIIEIIPNVFHNRLKDNLFEIVKCCPDLNILRKAIVIECNYKGASSIVNDLIHMVRGQAEFTIWIERLYNIRYILGSLTIGDKSNLGLVLEHLREKTERQWEIFALLLLLDKSNRAKTGDYSNAELSSKEVSDFLRASDSADYEKTVTEKIPLISCLCKDPYWGKRLTGINILSTALSVSPSILAEERSQQITDLIVSLMSDSNDDVRFGLELLVKNLIENERQGFKNRLILRAVELFKSSDNKICLDASEFFKLCVENNKDALNEEIITAILESLSGDSAVNQFVSRGALSECVTLRPDLIAKLGKTDIFCLNLFHIYLTEKLCERFQLGSLSAYSQMLVKAYIYRCYSEEKTNKEIEASISEKIIPALRLFESLYRTDEAFGIKIHWNAGTINKKLMADKQIILFNSFQKLMGGVFIKSSKEAEEIEFQFSAGYYPIIKYLVYLFREIGIFADASIVIYDSKGNSVREFSSEGLTLMDDTESDFMVTKLISQQEIYGEVLVNQIWKLLSDYEIEKIIPYLIKQVYDRRDENAQTAKKLLEIAGGPLAEKALAPVSISEIEKSQPVLSDEVTALYNDTIDLYDAGEFKVLWFDVLDKAFQEDGIYKIKYDESRLSESQIAIIKEYVRLLNMKTGGKFETIGCSSRNRSKETLLTVYRQDKAGNIRGKGCVDINIPEGEKIEQYALRITGMLNIALAASNIEENSSDGIQSSIAGFIRRQCRLMVEDSIAIPDNLVDLIEFIRNLPLPKASRMPAEKIEEYNRLAKEALTAA